jgi:hypothetical protein
MNHGLQPTGEGGQTLPVAVAAADEPWKNLGTVPTIASGIGARSAPRPRDGQLMSDGPPIFSQFDISSGSTPPVSQQPVMGDLAETNRLLRDLVVSQQKSNELLVELVNQVSLQQRQRVAELKARKEANPQLAKDCRRAAESLSKVHTEFLSSLAQEAADNADDFSDSEYALGEFIDRYGPRLAHFNGVLQLFAQLGAPLPQAETPSDG